MYLLDVNVLIALFDSAHVHHDAAHRWFEGCRTEGWATCPITENGFVRVVCSPAYPTVSPTPEEALERLAEFCTDRYHHFLADSVSLRNRGEGPGRPIRGGGQITDVYLLCLCRNAVASLATFDSRLRNSLTGSGWEGVITEIPGGGGRKG